MSKKKKVIGILITIVLILLIFFAGYSFAKYYTEVDGEGTGTIAKWSFIAGGGNGNIEEISLIDTANQVSLAYGKIAPGTEGKFDIVIDATGSEVGVDYNVKVLSETNLPTNMKYYLSEEESITSDKYSSFNELALAELGGEIPISDNQTKVITVNWEWPYESDIALEKESYDLADLLDGTKEDLEYKFVLQVIGQQSKII